MSLYEHEIGHSRAKRLQHLLAAFPYLLRHHIRPRCVDSNTEELQQSGHGLLLQEQPGFPVETRYEGDREARHKTSVEPQRNCWVDKRRLPWSLLPESILHRIAVAKNRPLWVCDHMSKELAQVEYTNSWTARERLQFLGQVEKLTSAIGECERIHHTAVPLNYARHSLRSLTLWLFTLPFALVKDLGLLTGLAMGVVAWLLFGVYEIGYSIEDPFLGSLRLSILCDNIRRDVLGTDVRETAYLLDHTSWEKLDITNKVDFKTIEEVIRRETIPLFVGSPEQVKVIVGSTGVPAMNTSDVGTWM